MTKPLAAILAAACAALALATAAAAEPHFGVAEDAGKYADDGGVAFFDTINDLGMTENRMWVFWDPARPDVIVEKPFLDRALPQAKAKGVRVVLSVSPLKARGVTRSRQAEDQFVAFLVLLARTYPDVKDIIVGNEPNQPRFWQPQFVNGKSVSGFAYEHLLARAYDALKAVDPTIRVIGVGLSPRGNDRPNAKSNRSTSPVRFLRDVGTAYRRSGRTKPIMDLFGFHAYPRFDRDPLERGYAWPNAGITNLDRIKQAVWDAFGGTAQPVFPEGPEPVGSDEPYLPPADPLSPEGLGEIGAEDPSPELAEEPLRFALDEVGWQVAIPKSFKRAYHGRESVRPTTEAAQASIYRQIVDIVACDQSVDSLLFFHLIDEHDLDRFQSGLLRADWSRRPAYDAVKSRIAALTADDGTVSCPGRPNVWRHSDSVIGAGVRFRPLAGAGGHGFEVRATEDVAFDAGAIRVAGPKGLTQRDRTGLESWSANAQGRLALPSSGALRAYERHSLPLRSVPLQPGYYVYVVRLAAAMNPERTSLFVSRPFRV